MFKFISPNEVGPTGGPAGEVGWGLGGPPTGRPSFQPEIAHPVGASALPPCSGPPSDEISLDGHLGQRLIGLLAQAGLIALQGR